MTQLLLPHSLRDAAPVDAPRQAFGTARLRLLAVDEGVIFADHLKRLGERGRRLRFGSPVRDAFIESYARRTLGEGAQVIGLFVGGTLRGVAELCFHPGTRETAEGAFSLESEFRRRGFGKQMFAALVMLARRHGVRRLSLQCLRENVAMQKIARSLKAVLQFEASEVTAELDLEPQRRDATISMAEMLQGFAARLVVSSPTPA